MTRPDDDIQWLDRARHPHLALLLDLDGTLLPFATTPEAADLDRAASSTLEALAQCGVRVVVVSGRPLPLIERVRSNVPQAWWFAEHGTWHWFDREWVGPHEAAAPDLSSLILALRNGVQTPGLRVELKSRSVCIHWRLVAAAVRRSTMESVESVCNEWLATQPTYERVDGAETLEVRACTAHKGAAVRLVRERMPDAYMIAIGDDDCDEDMFEALREHEVTIAVRNARHRPTRAGRSLADPPAVREFLWWIVDARTRPGLLPLPRFETSVPIR